MDLEDLYATAVESLWTLADALSDRAAAAARRGAVGHKTPASIERIYTWAQALEQEAAGA